MLANWLGRDCQVRPILGAGGSEGSRVQGGYSNKYSTGGTLFQSNTKPAFRWDLGKAEDGQERLVAVLLLIGTALQSLFESVLV